MTEVTLTPREMRTCIAVAADRLTASTEAGHNHASTYERGFLERIQQEIVGTCGEMALCKALGWFWSPSVNTFHVIADAGKNVEVRSTVRSDGCLIIRENDDPRRWYVLVTGEPPVMTIKGCFLGSWARAEKYVRNPHGHRVAWFVPQSDLRPPGFASITPGVG